MKSRTVQIIYMLHDGGTKDYHFVVLHDHAAGKSTAFTRWGKVGAGGQMKHTYEGDMPSVTFWLSKETDKRRKRDYGSVLSREFDDLKYMSKSTDPGMESLSKNIELARVIDQFMQGAGDHFRPATVADFVEPEPDIERGALWGSW